MIHTTSTLAEGRQIFIDKLCDLNDVANVCNMFE